MELEELYKEVQPRIYAFFFIKTSSKEIAEDLTQEVFYKLAKNTRYFGNGMNWLVFVFLNEIIIDELVFGQVKYN